MPRKKIGEWGRRRRVDNSSEVFTPLIEAEEDEEKRRFYLALQTYSLQQKQRIVLADENFVV